jgi:adenylate cyclase
VVREHPERKTPVPYEEQLVTLFADISGSSGLYDSLGDARAAEIVEQCVAIMTDATVRNGGTLLRTIGDEVMTTFPTVEAAANAACTMQENISDKSFDAGRPIAIRVGFHFGSLLLKDGDLYGDAVNFAKQVTNHAKPGQILTSDATLSQLPETARGFYRQIDIVQVKGKREEAAIYELVWQAEFATEMSVSWTALPSENARLALIAGNMQVELGEDRTSVSIGRSEGNDLILPYPTVSRLHARVGYNKGRFHLTDLSINGTYFRSDDGSSGYLHRDTRELTGSGTLGLGEAISAESLVTVRFVSIA